MHEPNGAESLVTALAASGVGLCLANSGTSEMHFVAALDAPGRPALDWVALARGHGVPALAVDDAAALVTALRRGFASRAPCLIVVRLAG